MSCPRIYIVIATFHPLIGGAERQALSQGRSLRERGYATTIVTFRHSRAWPSHEVIEGVPVIRVAGVLLGAREKLPRIFQKMLYLMALVVMGWTLWQKSRCYDILHVYQLNLLALPTALACWVTGKPMIIAVRCAYLGKKAPLQNNVSLNARQLDVTAPWLQVNGKARSEIESDLEDLERLGKVIVRFTRSLLKRTGAVVIVLSSGMKCYLAAHDFNLPHMQLIPNGVDTNRFTPRYEDIASNERAKVVVCVSRLNFQKGIDVLLQAWYLVHKQLPLARLIIVGSGPMQAQLVQMTQALDLAGSVEFTGPQSDVLVQFHRGGLAVLPSRWEGMPNAVLEAMACGLACVATRVSGSEDIIQHEVNGLLVEPEDYQGMAQALLTLLCDPMLAQDYGRAARATIEQRYSLEYITDTYITLYQCVANQTWQKSGDIRQGEIVHEKRQQGINAGRK